MYITKQMPMWKVAKEMGVAIGTVFNYLKKYDIETRSHKETFTMKGRKLTPEQVAVISRTHKGKTVSFETRRKISEAKKIHSEGHKKQRTDGYIAVYYPDHPQSTKDGYIMEHILVIEQSIGRHLNADECVHHINANRKDNRIENLKLMTKREHMSFHSKKRWEEIRRRNDLSIR